jgi:hypothetical protein
MELKIIESNQYFSADRKGKDKLIDIQKGLGRAKSIILILYVPSTYLAILGKMKRSWHNYEHSATDYSISLPLFGQIRASETDSCWWRLTLDTVGEVSIRRPR